MDRIEDPYPAYAWYREHEPVRRSEPRVWQLFRYADVDAVLHDHRSFSSRVIDSDVFQAHLNTTGTDPSTLLFQHFMLRQDPPDHTRLRGLVNKAFTPRTVERLRPRVQQVVDELLDGAEKNGGMDLVADFAYPLPVIVICELLGVPVEEREQWQRWVRDMLEPPAANEDEQAAVVRSRLAAMSLATAIGDLAAERRRRPRNDLLSALAATEEADRLSTEELLATGVLLFIAGHETTANLIANGTLALLAYPDQRERLVAERALAPRAVEELLRFDSPVQSLGRVATRDVVISDVPIARHDLVILFTGSANRDPAQFPEPDRLDLTRTPNRHLAFGVGIHACLGAPLGRLEGQVAIPTLLRRFPGLRLVGGPVQWREQGPSDITLRGPLALPVAV